jgi:hypothetical protein
VTEGRLQRNFAPFATAFSRIIAHPAACVYMNIRFIGEEMPDGDGRRKKGLLFELSRSKTYMKCHFANESSLAPADGTAETRGGPIARMHECTRKFSEKARRNRGMPRAAVSRIRSKQQCDRLHLNLPAQPVAKP